MSIPTDNTTDVTYGTSMVIYGTSMSIDKITDVAHGTRDVTVRTSVVTYGTCDVMYGTEDVTYGTHDVMYGTGDVIVITRVVTDNISNVTEKNDMVTYPKPDTLADTGSTHAKTPAYPPAKPKFWQECCPTAPIFDRVGKAIR